MNVKRVIRLQMGFFGLLLGLAVSEALAKCPADSVQVGPLCVDKYEASVWETTNAALIKKIQKGKAAEADLTAGGARPSVGPMRMTIPARTTAMTVTTSMR